MCSFLFEIVLLQTFFMYYIELNQRQPEQIYYLPSFPVFQMFLNQNKDFQPVK
jgi:hypothetical protein